MVAVLLAAVLTSSASSQSISIIPAPTVTLPSPTDSNSPAHWSNGKLTVFNAMGTPYRSEGSDQFSLGEPAFVSFADTQPMPLWIESTWVDDNGTVFAWYHHEPGEICPD